MQDDRRAIGELKEFLDHAHKFLAPWLISIVYCSNDKAREPEFKVASGFLVIVDDILVLVMRSPHQMWLASKKTPDHVAPRSSWRATQDAKLRSENEVRMYYFDISSVQ